MKKNKIVLTIFISIVSIFMFTGCAMQTKSCEKQLSGSIQLFMELPTKYNTPDGAALDNDGNIIMSIPNFNNEELLKEGKINKPSPPVMAKIDKNNNITTWYKFKKMDMHPETDKIGPMDAAFGPDGNLYVADMQIFWNGDHKSRLLRINIKNGAPINIDVVVEGFIVANGLTWKGNTLFVSETILEHMPKVKQNEKKPNLISGVYAFSLDEMKQNAVQLEPYNKNNPDKHLVATFKSSGRVGFGADGVTIDGDGNLYTAIVEDGVIYKTILDKQNLPIKTELFAKDTKMTSADGIVWNKTDNKIYIADFLGNAVHSLDMNGNIKTLHKNGDTDGSNGLLDEPCEVIIRGDELIIVNMDMPFGNPHLINTKIDKPYTLSVIRLSQ
ncbi:MAG: SMP-30/gluconolactonase/LRE family protein [Deltaproteobacteria bacterium]|nr:SMP-30/gluconolactonase/LRE family protein [Deltaproteobacteria bacterium]